MLVTILGSGMMGSAMAMPLCDRGHRVRLVGSPLDDAIIDGVRRDRHHPKLKLELPEVETAYATDAEKAVAESDVVLLGVSSAGIEWASKQLAGLRPDARVLMITKGVKLRERDGSHRIEVLPDVVASAKSLAGRAIAPVAVAGPCIAGELARRVPTCVLFTSRDPKIAQELVELCSTDYYHPRAEPDVVGAESCAALKNAYAMGVAFAMGKHEAAGGQPGSIAMHNAESAIFAQAAQEVARLAELWGGRATTALGLAGVGDLDVTNNGGRTGRFGRHLGRGLSLAEAIEAMDGATLECLEVLAEIRPAVLQAIERGALLREAMPLLLHLFDVAAGERHAELPLAHFFRTAMPSAPIASKPSSA